MPVVVVDLAFAVLVAATGVGLGWWLRSGGSWRERADEDTRRAQEVLARLHDLAARVAADVGEHNSRVEEINEELTASEMLDADVVVSAVDRLVEANDRMQKQLASAEERLREQARQMESAATEARTDVLTGLANRRALDDATAGCLAEFQKTGKSFSTLMIDVDHFKKFNDRHGHQAGDEVLRRVGGILRQNIRPGGLAARYGGEEFALILPGVPVTDAIADAERVRTAIDRARFRFAGSELHVTASVGAAELISGEDVATMIKRADASLYASKEAGRNCTHWHDGEKCWPVGQKPQEGSSPPGKTPSAENRRATPPRPAPRQERPQTASPRPREIRAAAHNGQPSQATLCDGEMFCSMLSGRLSEWRRGGAAPCVLLVHIDKHQAIVSRHGTAAGSRVFHTTVRFLRAAVRDMDVVAHYEDATFALMLPGTGLASAIGVAERIRQAITRCNLPVPGGRVQFTVSIGGAEAMRGDDTRRLLERAREAVEAAMQSSGNCCYFHNGQWSETVQATMEKALAR